MNEYSILLLSQIDRQEAIQRATAIRLVRRGKKAAEGKAQPRRVNVMSVAQRWWLWARQLRFGPELSAPPCAEITATVETRLT